MTGKEEKQRKNGIGIGKSREGTTAISKSEEVRNNAVERVLEEIVRKNRNSPITFRGFCVTPNSVRINSVHI